MGSIIDKDRIDNIQEWYDCMGMCHPEDIKYMVKLLKNIYNENISKHGTY
tara:strand:+ start:655 stop:804 length:150 start_codon:yes stop_codon:yes gene_type:complete